MTCEAIDLVRNSMLRTYKSHILNFYIFIDSWLVVRLPPCKFEWSPPVAPFFFTRLLALPFSPLFSSAAVFGGPCSSSASGQLLQASMWGFSVAVAVEHGTEQS